eukprot:TRINITY_DN1435_c0_g1_i1.p1 TRINITY_DN1435_c0_g1~~TRINITY_DN1435_c0_g1_i1.p1  ORF type:complete len:182 (+),score=37.02 TRINITY_DN1435_c0_g1_i1:177-722(+)
MPAHPAAALAGVALLLARPVAASPPPAPPVPTSFDCEAGFKNWEATWSPKKIKWCCENKKVACKSSTESVAAADGPVEDVHDQELRSAHARHLQAISSTSHHYLTGAWLYGDYRTAVEGPNDAAGCARACEDDEGCYHWNFHVTKLRCDFKGTSAKFDSDKSDHIGGNSARYRNSLPPGEL